MSSYNSIYLMLVFGVKYRLGFISEEWKEQLYAVMVNAAKRCDCKTIAIGGVKDHVHILLSLGGNAPAPKDIMRVIKTNSSKWINDKRLCPGRFGWQDGGSKFSYSYREIEMMKNYILNQERHHYSMTYREEIERFLKSAGIIYDEKFLPAEVE